jgi:hypothetical protein
MTDALGPTFHRDRDHPDIEAAGGQAEGGRW